MASQRWSYHYDSSRNREMAAARDRRDRREARVDASNTTLYLNEVHRYPASKPAPLLTKRQSNLRDLSQEGFSEDERRILQHAADILKVPCSKIIDLQRSQATSNYIPNLANPDSGEPSWAQEIPHATSTVIMNTQPFLFDVANINIPATSWTSGQNFPPYSVFQALEGSSNGLSTDSSTTSKSTSVPEVHIHNPSKVQEANWDNIFMDHTLSSGLDLTLQSHIQNLFEAPNGRLDNFADNTIFPILEASAWHNQTSLPEADWSLQGQAMMGTHMFSSITDAAVGPQLSTIEPTTLVRDGMADFGLASNMLLQPIREASIPSSGETLTAEILPINVGHRDVVANNSNKHVTQLLIHRPLHPASSSRCVEASREAAHTPRNRRRGGQGAIRKVGRQGPLKPEERAETGLTRKMNACMRCHMQRSRCLPNLADPFGCCLTCLKLSGPTLTKLPCLRYKISDSQLLDKGPHPRFSWTRRWTSMKIVEIDDWQSEEIKTITLTQDVGGAQYSLQVRKFTPRDGDSLARGWNSKDGTRSHPCAPYAIADMRAASDILVKFVDTNIGTFISHYVAESDKLMTRTYELAHHGSLHAASSQERSLLRAVLRLWVASRMESKQERICSAEVLGMTPQNWDPEATNFRNYLVPPVMQAQIEIITTTMVLLPMKQAVLKDLQSLVEKNKAESWFTIYLATFIILHSCALLTRAEAVRAIREGHVGPKARYSQSSIRVMLANYMLLQSRYHNYQLVEEFHNGARTMLAYYHYCNKGSHPFSMDWTNQSNITFARLGAEQVQYMQEMQAEVEDRGNHFRYIKQDNVFEDDYYFVSQLYELYWTPTHTV